MTIVDLECFLSHFMQKGVVFRGGWKVVDGAAYETRMKFSGFKLNVNSNWVSSGKLLYNSLFSGKLRSAYELMFFWFVHA